MRVIEDLYPWKSGSLDLEDPELRALSDEASLSVSEPFQHIDIAKSGLHTWHIKDGATVHWRRQSYGCFYEKDAFLILHIRSPQNDGDKPQWNLHLWLGRKLTIEDHRVASYRTAEMNSLLNNEAILHREPQNKETAVFKAYFQFITYYKGSANEDYWQTRLNQGMHPTRLMKIAKPDARLDQYKITEVPARHSQLNSSFVYIMDRGNTLCQWNGELCKTDDVLQAIKYVQWLKSARGTTIKVDIINDNGEDQGGHAFYSLLSRTSYMNVRDEEEERQRTLSFPSTKRTSTVGTRGQLFKVVSQPNRSPYFKKVKEGVMTKKDLAKETQCIIDLEDMCFLWFSHKIAVADKSRSLDIVQHFLTGTSHPVIPVIILTEGQYSPLVAKAIGT